MFSREGRGCSRAQEPILIEKRRLGRLLFTSMTRDEVAEAKAKGISKVLADTAQKAEAILTE